MRVSADWGLPAYRQRRIRRAGSTRIHLTRSQAHRRFRTWPPWGALPCPLRAGYAMVASRRKQPNRLKLKGDRAGPDTRGGTPPALTEPPVPCLTLRGSNKTFPLQTALFGGSLRGRRSLWIIGSFIKTLKDNGGGEGSRLMAPSSGLPPRDTTIDRIALRTLDGTATEATPNERHCCPTTDYGSEGYKSGTPPFFH